MRNIVTGETQDYNGGTLTLI